MDDIMSALARLADGEELYVTWMVTDEDIQHGLRSSCRECPQARALARALPGLIAEVGDTWTHMYEDLAGERGEQLYWAKTLGRTQRFIHEFDRGEYVLPGEFSAYFSRVYRPIIVDAL